VKVDERRLWDIITKAPPHTLIDLLAEGQRLGIPHKRIAYFARKWGRRSDERPEGVWEYGTVWNLGWREL